MARWSFTLIAAFAVASVFNQPAVGQFKIPKIKIPKIVTEAPTSTTSSSDTDSSPSVSVSSPSSRDDEVEVRGRPIQGARMTFSNNPDGSNPKTTFTSSEYIYGHLDLGGRTVYDVFGLKNQTDVPVYYINYDLNIMKPGEPLGNSWGGSRNFTLVTKEDAQKTYWNFDVLPDPAKVSTFKSALADEKDFSKKFPAGIYTKWYDADSARSTFPQNGTYTIDVTVWGDAFDDWGKPTGSFEGRPTATAHFAFQFSGSDGQRLIANQVAARENIEKAKNASEMYHAMPDWWAKGAVPPEPKLTPARLVPLIKDYIAKWNLTYMKHMINPFRGPVWAVEKNEIGIPRYRRVTSAIYIIYREAKDNSCQVGALEMYEPYAGGGTYSSPVLNGISDIRYIDCAAVK